MTGKIKIAGREFTLHEGLSLLLAFSLPLYARIPPVIIALLGINWLFTNDWRHYVSRLSTKRIALLPAVLYLFYFAGVFFSDNTSAAWFDMQVKLSLLLLPLVLVSVPVTPRSIEQVMYAFTAGCLLATFCCIGHSVYLYYDEIDRVKEGLLKDTYTNLDFFFSSNLSCFFHPSYLSMYLCFSVGFILLLFSRETDRYSFARKVLIFLLLLYFSVFVFFLASRMGMIVLILTWIFFSVRTIITSRRYGTGAVLLTLVIGGTFTLYHSSQIIASRFDYAVHSFFSANIDKTSSESSAVRMLVWSASREVITEHPLGVGTGDVTDVLLKKYAERGMTYVHERGLNSHSQFLQTTIALGIAGGLFLVLVFGSAGVQAIRQKNLIGMLFLMNCILNFSVESMLEVQAGVLFFAFFYSFLNGIE